MLELSLTEILVVVVMAILVLRPEDVPQVVRGAMRFFRQLQSMVGEVKSQVHQAVEETGAGEAVQQMREEARYIRDMQGNLQRVYDVDDLLPTSTPEKPAATPES